MLTDKLKISIHSILDDNLSTPFDYTKIYGLEYCADEIVKLLTPKLDWKQEAERVWSGKTPFGYRFVISQHSTGYWEVANSNPVKFRGELDECKKECERLFMEMYLTTCNE